MKLLLLTPPLVQTNCPYPATTHLTGFLRECGIAVEQRDLSVKVAQDVLVKYGGDTAEELLELLRNPRMPAEAKREAGKVIDEIALQVRDTVDESFGFSRYAERISASASNFDAVQKIVTRRGVIDEPLERHLEAAIRETKPNWVGVTCPFPGTLVGAFKIARHIRRKHPKIKTVLGGGFVNTELRDMDDARAFKYFDKIVYDEGYAPLAKLMGKRGVKIPPFVCPSYDGIDMDEYFDVVETDNPMHRMWSCGRWIRLIMARGCYWHKCAFCDVRLPYIGCFEMPRPEKIVDAMETLGTEFHFVDEAMPPMLVRRVCEEILQRKFKCRWWGNIRLDAAFTRDLARLMAKAGCVAVTGGLECANDRLLRLMNKGITLKSSERALRAFHKAGIMVHAYLMYGFPTETESETMGALEHVRKLFAEDLVQSAFWHRFALTVHSPIAANPERFGIRIVEPKKGRRRTFCRNEIGFEEMGAPDWERIGKILNLAMYNFLQGRGLDKKANYWRRCVERQR